MKPEEAADFSKLWSGAWGFYDKDASSMMITIAFRALQQYELRDISRALSLHLVNPDAGQFPPKPADIVRYLDGGSETRAMRALAKAERAWAHIGAYESVCFDDPIVHAVLQDMGGWIVFCGCSEQEKPFRNREFEKRYQGYVLQPPTDYPRKLVGITESSNGIRGLTEWVKPPMLVGDEKKLWKFTIMEPQERFLFKE